MYENNGYMRLVIYDYGEPITIYEHKLNALINNSLHDVLNNDVHHKNHCRFDNRIENLELISKSEHHRLHNVGNKNPHFNPCIRIRKYKDKSCKQGFRWFAQPYTKDSNKPLSLSSVDLDKCIEKVEEFIKSKENTLGYTSYEVII